MELIFAFVLIALGAVLHVASTSPSSLDSWISRINPNGAHIARVVIGSKRIRGNPSSTDRLWVIASALVVGCWILAYKLRSFYWLTTTSDLYDFAELSTSWLKGHYMQENCFGDMLSFHAFLNTPLLAVFSVPMGAMGLMVATAVASFAGCVAMCRILARLGVPAWAAGVYAAVASVTPLALHTYADVLYGFNPEILVPALALWLGYFLLERNWLGSVLMAVATFTVKEEYPLVVIVVCMVFLSEDFVSCLDRSAGVLKPVNWPAAFCAVLAVFAIPLLLLVIKLHPATGYSPGSFNRLKPLDGSEVTSLGSLVDYMSSNLFAWLNGKSLGGWLGLVVPATFGLIVLRPHLILLGFGLTLISWLMQDDLLWAPRFAGSLAFIQIIQVLGFASFWTITQSLRGRGRWGTLGSGCLSAALIASITVSISTQLRIVPDAREVYTLRPTSKYSPDERADADALFETYRRLSKPEEPVIADEFLFRYAHDRNLFWADRLDGRPKPLWILWDGRRTVDEQDYHVVGRKGRFYLYRRNQ